jgi:hypothetical protein
MKLADGGYEPTMVPITLGRGVYMIHLPPQESSYLDENISITNIQPSQFSCSDHHG